MVNNNEYGIIARLFTSRKMYLSQLKEQGYETENYENFSINEVNIMFQNKQQDMLINHPDGTKVYISYHVEKALRPQNIHDMIDDLYEIDKMLTAQDILTIIVKDAPNDTLTHLIMNIYANTNIFINILYLGQLQFNVLEHSLVPQHKKLTHDEGEDIKKKYNIASDKELPEISRFDPPAQILGLRPGDICHIVRPSKISVTVDHYRVCVNKKRKI